MADLNGDLERRLADLSPEKLELLRSRLRKAPQAAPSPPPETVPLLEPRPEDRHLPFPLTEVQEAYWIGRNGHFDLSRSASSYMEYDIPEVGAGFVDRLEWAVQEFIERHDMLRMVVLSDGFQQVLPEVPLFRIDRVSLRGLGTDETEAALRAARDRMCNAERRVDRWPLFEILVHELSDSHVRVHLLFDALLKDGQSRGILLWEVPRLFADPATIPPLSCTYRDFAVSRASREQSEPFRRSEAYWRQRLPVLPPGPELPLKTGLRTPTRFTSRDLDLLPTEAWHRLKTRAVKAGLTPSSAVLAAFCDVVAAWSETSRFTLGLIGSERPPVHPEIDGIFGNFNDLLLFAVDDLSGNFLQRARRHQERLATDLEHRHFSGFRVLRELNRLAGGSPRAAVPVFFNCVLEEGAGAGGGQDDASQPDAASSRQFVLTEVDANVHLPQILILSTILEAAGRGLICKWQAVEDAFPPSVLDDFLAALTRHLESLAASETPWNEAAPDLLPPDQRKVREAAGTPQETARVLSERGEPRPDWVAGELWRGERQTGLAARFLPGGEVDVLGRPDEAWVDKAGRRVELRRIETTLERHPGVQTAVVLPRADGDGRTRLQAFVLPSGNPPDTAGLAGWLAEQLPPHLLPDAFETLPELPRTTDGAVDRSALKARLRPRPAPPATPVAPRDEKEAALADIWHDLLGVRPASITDDFFALGGNSLQVVRLFARLHERFGLERSLPSFFESPTVEHLAECLRQSEQERLSRADRAPTLLGRLLRFTSKSHRRRQPPSPSRDAARTPGGLFSPGMRTYLLLWFSQFVSGVGTGLGAFALGVWVYRQNASATQYSIFAFIATGTGMLVGPLAGVLADRWDRKRLILLGDTGAAVMTGLMALALYTGQMRLWHVYIIVVAMVGFGALQGPALFATVSQLVSRRQLVRVSGLTITAGIATGLICPPLSGALIPIIGYHGVIAIDISTFLFAFLVLLFIRLPRPSATAASRERRSFLGDFRFGWDYLRQRPGLLSLLWVFAVTNFALSIVQVLLTPLILSFASATGLGFVNAAMVAGSLSGSLALSVWGGPKNRVGGILLFLLLQGPLLLFGALRPNVTLISVACFIFSLLVPLITGLSQAIWQSKVAHGIQGRVFAMRGLIANSIAPLAFLLAGPLADRVFGPLMAPGGALADTVGRIIGVGKERGVVLLFMTLGLVLTLAVLRASRNPRLRNVESELPDANPDPEADAGRAQQETLAHV